MDLPSSSSSSAPSAPSASPAGAAAEEVDRLGGLLHGRSSTPSASARLVLQDGSDPEEIDYRNLVFKNRSQKLEEIEGSLKHKLTLLDWNAQLAASNDNVGRKLSSRNASTSDLYQILGLFFVFEGVVITAVAQATAIRCRHSWLIFSLSLLASAATFAACIQKLREIRLGKRIYLEERALCSSLFNSIEKLKEAGADEDFDLEENQPKLSKTYPEPADQSSGWPGFSVWAHKFWKRWVWSYAGGVVFVLMAFSGLTLTAVHLIVCDPQRNLASP